ncbi:uncharacterized protein, partial [Triticum aestivum]|uniref:uncharacterized protein n=1 Tax=Triticum aestivum TaxID=4565 RepID=UPI001D02BEAE
MSSGSDSQNMSEQNVDLSEGSSLAKSYYEGIKSSLDLPKAPTRTKKKRNSDDEAAYFLASEATSKKKAVLRKEYGTSASTRPSAKDRTVVRKVPLSKANKATTPKETMTFILEDPSDAEADASKKKKRARKTTVVVIGKPSMREDDHDEEEEEEEPAPPAKTQKLMSDAMKSAAPSKPKSKPKAPAPKRSTRNIFVAKKNKAPLPEVNVDDEPLVLRKLKPKIPDHDNAHPVAENMMLRKDKGLHQWRMSNPYSVRRRTACDYHFHTREQHDFYETVLLDKKPILSDMKWVDWKYIDANEDHFPHVHESFRLVGVDDFVGQKLTKWNDEMIMQFYPITHFYPDGKVAWMTEVPAGKLLGFLVSDRGIEANPEKIKAITSLAKPACINDVQRLAGRIAALSRFISRLGEKAMPLYQLMKKTDNFVWNDAADTAFEDLKKQLAEPPVLTAPVDKEPLLLYVAANTRAVSVAMVVERKEEGK